MSENSESITRFGMAPRIAGMSFADFQAHWRTTHADVVADLPGLRTYVQHHAVLRDGRPVLPYPGFDACSMMIFDDLEAMDAAFDSAVAHGQIKDDEGEFVDKSRFTWMATRPAVRIGDLPPDPVKLLTLWRPAPGVDGAQLEAALRTTMTSPRGRERRAAHEQFAEIAGAHDDRQPAAARVLQIDHYASVGDALADAASAEADEAARALAGGGQAVARHLATEVRVVG